MGFGQYTGYDSKRDRGYPADHEAVRNARRGYIRKADQLAHETEPVVWSRKRGASATIYATESGRLVYRLYDTNIIERTREEGQEARITLNTGGWNTITTRQHMMGALREDFGILASVWGVKDRKEGRNVLRSNGREWTFDRTVTVPVNALREAP